MGLAAAVPIVPPSGRAGQDGGHRSLWGGRKAEKGALRSRSRLGWGLVSGLSHPSRRGAASAAGSGGSVLVPRCHRGLDAAPHPAHQESPHGPRKGGPGAGIPQMALIQDPGDPARWGQHLEVISLEKPRAFGSQRGV